MIINLPTGIQITKTYPANKRSIHRVRGELAFRLLPHHRHHEGRWPVSLQRRSSRFEERQGADEVLQVLLTHGSEEAGYLRRILLCFIGTPVDISAYIFIGTTMVMINYVDICDGNVCFRLKQSANIKSGGAMMNLNGSQHASILLKIITARSTGA